MGVGERVRIEKVEVLSQGWSVLRKTTFSYLRNDGSWQQQARETYDRGNGAAILLYDLARRTVILTRQFRYPAFVNGHDDLLVEAPAGLLDNAGPEERIRAETEEETGFRVRDVRQIFDAFMAPAPSPSACISSSANTSSVTALAQAAAKSPKARTSRCWKSISTRPSP